jgi:hypothetical protein
MSLRFPSRRFRTALLLAGLSLTTTACWQGPSKESQRLDVLEQRLQQIEQRLATPAKIDTSDPSGKPPAGAVKSLTFRMGTEDDRLRIYWADGSSTDLPCTKEQATWVCG